MGFINRIIDAFRSRDDDDYDEGYEYEDDVYEDEGEEDDYDDI